ncbi:DNA alkylation repair protein [Paenibacillus sp. FSL H8-0548]|uniref:DNA alkylation repair protein n=1 Tax=Paenibacillus sp. FSL H8-0548 TaxID=1920422 RepID=UPI00096CCAF8|nr:DNA alkylation repair protein [Paenibacillus sp. FSL H8-0548]OMF21340.1 DNA alkylation repair protein [Paenibacillus sp. FSL H8-0548]
MTSIARELETLFRENANPERALPMEAYMRGQFVFLGIKTPERIQLLREFWKINEKPKGEELLRTAEYLWELREREFHYAAMSLMDKYSKEAAPSHIDKLEQWVTTHSWWDTVDFIASHLVGFHLSKYPELIEEHTERWIVSDNLWLRRTALLFQLKYKQATDTERLFAYIRLTMGENEFFIRKAIGWSLREYAKTDAASIRRFVAETPLAPLSKKEALKHIL